MNNYLDYSKNGYQEGYTKIDKSRDSIINHINKKIVLLRKRDYDRNRGYLFPIYGTLTNIYRNILIINDYSHEIDISELLEIAIKNE